ncbi:MAG: hypothetical protein HOK67_31860 [Deltaproteobacteria bacterium]|jgi:hypothetical protein|nr:hypothetical protein [Deltaproteobacteria bacterium]MBT4642755.1 hypothetical protein [Deltaproteobacteria bacterium]MBT6504493.1 hypothetical protein [Deltaproteobacteria bacterium]MBT6611060.1 hypothetical protein [Deltaproteobacteria bacterium]
MKILKTLSIVMLIVFGLALPVSLLVTDVSRQVFSEEGLTELTMASTLSNEGLPQRIRETIWFHHWYSEKLEYGPRLLATGIRADQWVDLFAIVLPEKEREKVVSSVTGGLFTWLENDEAYPQIRVDLAPALANVHSNADEAALWAINGLKIPACKENRVKELQTGNYGNELKALISCRPPVAERKGVAEHLAPIVLKMLDQANPPQSIDVTQQLKSRFEEGKMVAMKSKLNQARKALSLIWILPFVVFILALALVVRSREQLMRWAGWSLLASGATGGILAWTISSPLPALDSVLMPPPVTMPTQAVPVIKGVMSELLTGASGMMTWQLGIVFLAGAGLLIKSYLDRFSKQTD